MFVASKTINIKSSDNSNFSLYLKSFNSERDSRERIITAGLAEKAKNNGQDVEKNLDYIKGQLSEKGINKKDIDKYITGIKEINKWKI